MVAPLRVGIIGTGSHGSRYANHVAHDIAGLKLVAISRRSGVGGKQAAGWNCTWYADWRDLIAAPDVDAVIAVVPPGLNLSIAHHCAAGGKPLLVEKPLGASSGDAAAISALYSSRNLPLTTGQTLRFNPVIRALRKQLPVIGRLYSFSANQRLEPSTLAWHEEPDLAGAGVSIHTAVHVFDALRFITGLEVRRLLAVVRRHNQRFEDLLAVMVEMEEKVVGTIDCSKVGHARSGRFEFVGQEGQLHGDQVHQTLELVQGCAMKKLDPGEGCNTIIPLLQEWQAFVRGQGPNPVSGGDGLAAVRLCEACLDSARSGTWVELNG